MPPGNQIMCSTRTLIRRSALLLGICLCFRSAKAQLDTYYSIGFTPRYVLNSNLMDELHRFEASLHSVTTPFDEVNIIPGIELYISYPIDNKINMGFSLNYSRFVAYSEGQFLSNAKSSARISFSDVLLSSDINYRIYQNAWFWIGPGAGYLYNFYSSSGTLINTSTCGTCVGGLDSGNLLGQYMYILLILDFDTFGISIRPTYYNFMDNYRYSDTIEETLPYDEYTVSVKSADTFLGFNVYITFW